MSESIVTASNWCAWAASSREMQIYHDTEWGIPTSDDRHLFEKICLEAFQCGLSWATVLAKRERLRSVFARFDIDRLIEFSDEDLVPLACDPSIIRHRGKIAAVVTNARACRSLVDEFGSLSAYMWSFAPDRDQIPSGPAPPATSQESIALSRDLKRRGWVFVGPTTMYALMQSMGMVNDHDVNCPFREVARQARRSFQAPVAN